MNSVKDIFIKLILVFAILCSTVSCVSDLVEPVITCDEMELSVGFRMPTRTSSGDLYEEGEIYENYIDIAEEDYRIYFFDTNNKFISRFHPNGFVATEGSNYREYNVTGTAPHALITKRNFKVVVIANWPTYLNESEMIIGTTTIEDLCNSVKSQFEQFTSFSLDTELSIPFYGMREFTNIEFEPYEATILPDPITLLRAVSKVEVVLKSEPEHNLTLSSVQICRYNNKGYCAPNADKRSEYDHDGIWGDDYAESLHLVNGKNDVDDEGNIEDKKLPFLKVASWDEDGNRFEKWIAYLTEYQNIGADDGYCYIETKFNNQLESDIPHKIYFAEYTDGLTDNADANRLNVERNNLYRFNVIATPLQLLVSVDEWIHGGTVHIEM